MPDVSVLDVLLHDERIGTLTRLGGDRSIFAFSDDYAADDARPVLGLGFKDIHGALITDFKPVRTRVMPFFANLLPEGHLRDYLAERAGVSPTREFFLLRALGADLPGAITVRPVHGDDWPEAEKGDADEDAEVLRENALRFSLAGVQLKFSAIDDARGGLAIPAKGVGGSWIVKLPSSVYKRVPENEYAMMTLARAVGIDVPPVQLVEIDAIVNLPENMGGGERLALAVERFDRLSDGTRVHIEDFAQVFGVYPEEKYKRASYRNIAAVLAAEAGIDDVAELIRRFTFNALIGNADMHLKNWSLIYPDRRAARLAPAYDLVSTVAYIPDEHAALNVSRTKRFDEFTFDELSHLAAKARISEPVVLKTARETVARFREVWGEEKFHLPIAEHVRRSIETQLSKVPIAATL
ncbi:MAG: HipA domain-containing protein [Azospirillaceae bacterium]